MSLPPALQQTMGVQEIEARMVGGGMPFMHEIVGRDIMVGDQSQMVKHPYEYLTQPAFRVDDPSLVRPQLLDIRDNIQPALDRTMDRTPHAILSYADRHTHLKILQMTRAIALDSVIPFFLVGLDHLLFMTNMGIARMGGMEFAGPNGMFYAPQPLPVLSERLTYSSPLIWDASVPTSFLANGYSQGLQEGAWGMPGETGVDLLGLTAMPLAPQMVVMQQPPEMMPSYRVANKTTDFKARSSAQEQILLALANQEKRKAGINMMYLDGAVATKTSMSGTLSLAMLRSAHVQPESLEGQEEAHAVTGHDPSESVDAPPKGALLQTGGPGKRGKRVEKGEMYETKAGAVGFIRKGGLIGTPGFEVPVGASIFSHRDVQAMGGKDFIISTIKGERGSQALDILRADLKDRKGINKHMHEKHYGATLEKTAPHVPRSSGAPTYHADRKPVAWRPLSPGGSQHWSPDSGPPTKEKAPRVRRDIVAGLFDPGDLSDVESVDLYSLDDPDERTPLVGGRTTPPGGLGDRIRDLVSGRADLRGRKRPVLSSPEEEKSQVDMSSFTPGKIRYYEANIERLRRNPHPNAHFQADQLQLDLDRAIDDTGAGGDAKRFFNPDLALDEPFTPSEDEGNYGQFRFQDSLDGVGLAQMELLTDEQALYGAAAVGAVGLAAGAGVLIKSRINKKKRDRMARKKARRERPQQPPDEPGADPEPEPEPFPEPVPVPVPGPVPGPPPPTPGPHYDPGMSPDYPISEAYPEHGAISGVPGTQGYEDMGAIPAATMGAAQQALGAGGVGGGSKGRYPVQPFPTIKGMTYMTTKEDVNSTHSDHPPSLSYAEMSTGKRGVGLNPMTDVPLDTIGQGGRAISGMETIFGVSPGLREFTMDSVRNAQQHQIVPQTRNQLADVLQDLQHPQDRVELEQAIMTGGSVAELMDHQGRARGTMRLHTATDPDVYTLPASALEFNTPAMDRPHTWEGQLQSAANIRFNPGELDAGYLPELIPIKNVRFQYNEAPVAVMSTLPTKQQQASEGRFDARDEAKYGKIFASTEAEVTRRSGDQGTGGGDTELEQVLIAVAQRLQQNDWIWGGAGVNKRVHAGKSPFAVMRAAQDIVRCITSVRYVQEMYPHSSGRLDRIFETGMACYEREAVNAFECFSAHLFDLPIEIAYFLCAMMQKSMQWIGGIQNQLNLLSSAAMTTFGGYQPWAQMLEGIVESYKFNPVLIILRLHEFHVMLENQCNASIDQIIEQMVEEEDPAIKGQLDAGLTNILHRKEYFVARFQEYQELEPMLGQMHRTQGQGKNVARVATRIGAAYGEFAVTIKKAVLVTSAQICTELRALDSAKVEPVEVHQLKGFRRCSLKPNWSGHGIKLAPAPVPGEGVQILSIPSNPSPYDDRSIYQRGVRL